MQVKKKIPPKGTQCDLNLRLTEEIISGDHNEETLKVEWNVKIQDNNQDKNLLMGQKATAVTGKKMLCSNVKVQSLKIAKSIKKKFF